MKSLPITGLCWLASLASTLALTEADITPPGIAGKSFTFTIETGAAPFSTNGSWTGTFGASPGNVFTAKKGSGDTFDSSGKWTFNSSFSGLHEYTISPFIDGQPDGVLTLWISNGGGRYEVFLTGVFGNSQTGSFTLGAATTAEPEIKVAQPAKSDLTDGKANKAFGRVSIGKSSAARIFTIKNTGDAALEGLAVQKTGTHKSDFIITALGKTSLGKDESTSFKVSFKPKAKGNRNAAIRIISNDKDENPFDIKLSGFGAKK